MEGLSGMMIRAGGALLSSRNWGQRGETDGGRRIRGRMSLELDDDKEAGNDDGDGEDDDYDTGVTWWGLVLVILGSAALCGFVAYFFVCRRMQARSRSEDFSSKVITAPDTPWMRTGSEGSITNFTVGGGGSSSRGGPSSPSTGGASSPLARSVRRARSASKHDSGQRDFRQALMHDDEEARDILIRSSVLYAEDNNVDDVDAATTAGGRTTMTTARPGAYAPPPVINHPPPGETAAAAGR